MSKQDGVLSNNRLPKDPSDDSTRSLSTTRPSNLPATTIFRPENALPGYRTSSPNCPDTSNRLSSPSVRTLARQNTVNQVQRRQSRTGAPGQQSPALGGSISSATRDPRLGGQAKRPLMLPGPTVTIRPSASTQADPSASLSNLPSGSPLVGIQKSKGPASRKRATPTKPLPRSQCQRLLRNAAPVKPFEKLETLEAKLRTSLQSSEFSDDLRRLHLATTIHRRLKASVAQRPSIQQGGLPQQTLVPDIKDLALGQLIVVDDQKSCSFCSFECSYGCSNEEILLPASASYHRCLDCQPTRLFDEVYENTEPPQTLPSVSVLKHASNAPLWTQTAPNYRIFIQTLSGRSLFLDVKSSDKVLDVKFKLSQCIGINWNSHHLYCSGAVLNDNLTLSQHRIGPRSLVEIVKLKWVNGFDLTQFWKPIFCSGCPWTQVDIKLAKICIPCAEEKFAIINHSRHGSWAAFSSTAYGDYGAHISSHRQGNCMICTKLASMKCAGCLLVVCINCSTQLDGRCKGSLNLLLYSCAQEHIRNDAFLLRSDGGGF